jgi:hypothetical protein
VLHLVSFLLFAKGEPTGLNLTEYYCETGVLDAACLAFRSFSLEKASIPFVSGHPLAMMQFRNMTKDILIGLLSRDP